MSQFPPGIYRRRQAVSILFAALVVTALPACGPPRAPAPLPVTDARLLAADSEPQNWLSHGRTYDERRYSPLRQIHAANIAGLGLAWAFELAGNRGLEATPVVVDGVIYITGNWSRVYALRALTGELLWQYDPEVPPQWAVNLCCDVVNRGVAVWRDRVYVGTLDGRLVALDAGSGKPVWSVQTTPRDKPYSITGAPRVVKGKVVIGNGGAEMGVRGYVSAYDAGTGELAWRFYTVPGNPALPFENPALKMAAQTWKGGEWWQLGGGGTVWDSMSYDAELDLLYIGVGNGSPWSHKLRSPGGGDNLFLSSIVALRPDTGEYVWHYQTTPGESWDYTATQQMILAELAIEGRSRKVIMQAPKNGFFYVLDRETGAFLSAEPYVEVNWASHIDPHSGRPVIRPGARYRDQPFLGRPSPFGGHNWHSMSYSPDTGLVYIPAMDLPFHYQQDSDFEAQVMGVNLGIDGAAAAMPEDSEIRKAIKAMLKGRLVAWDPVRQRAAWTVEQRNPWNGGTLATAGGLVFQGNGQGEFVAYAAGSGKRLWSFDAQTGIVAAPVSFALAGEQYVAVLAGWGGVMPLLLGEAVAESAAGKVNRLLVFKLGGTAQLPVLEAVERQLNPPPLTAPAAVVRRGKVLYHRFCFACHGDSAVAGGVLADLRYSAFNRQAQAWRQVVLDGALKSRGMVSFAPVLDPEDAEAIRAYVIERAHSVTSH